MRRRSRIPLLGLATAVVLACALVLILDRPADRSPAGASATATGPAAADAGASSGFDGALLPGGVSAPNFTLTDQHGRRVSLESIPRPGHDPHVPLHRLPPPAR